MLWTQNKTNETGCEFTISKIMKYTHQGQILCKCRTNFTFYCKNLQTHTHTYTDTIKPNQNKNKTQSRDATIAKVQVR